MPSVSRRTLWTLYFIVFVDMFQLAFILPLLPKIVETLSPGTASGLLGTAAEKIGLLAGLGAACEGIAAPYLGRLADRIGRRPVFMAAQVGASVSAVIVGLAPSYTVLIMGRIVNGLCGGTAGIAAAYVADVTTEEERPGCMTFYMAAVFLGWTVGPGLGGYLSLWKGWRVACVVAACTSAVNFVSTVFFLPESPAQHEGEEQEPEEGDSEQQGAENVSCMRRITGRCCKKALPFSAWLICTSSFLANVGWTVFEALGVLYIEDSFFTDMSRKDAETAATSFYSQLLSGAGFVGLVVNLFLYTHVEHCTGLKGSIALGGTLKAVGYLGIALPSLGKWAMFGSTLVVVLGDQLQETSIQTLITCVVPPTRFGEAMGLMTLFGNVARAVGPFAFGPVYEHGSKTLPWTSNIFASLLVIGLCSIARSRTSDQTTEALDATSSSAGTTEQRLSRHFSRQTSRSMLLSGQGNFAKMMVEDTTAMVRTRSAPADRSGGSPRSPQLIRAQTAT